MKLYRLITIVMFASGLFAAWAMIRPVLAQERERVEQHMRELDERIERAKEGGRKQDLDHLMREKMEVRERMQNRERVSHGEGERDADPRQHQEDRERHVVGMEMHAKEIELELKTLELEKGRVELRSNPIMAAIQAIESASERLAPEEAVELLSGLLEKSKLFPVKLHMRQRLVELNLNLDRRNEAIKHLRAIILLEDE